MGGKSTTIVEDMIRWVLSVEAGVIKPETDNVPDTFKIPDDYAFEKATPEFQLKVFKKTLDEIIRIFEENTNLQKLPMSSIMAIQDGLIDTNEGFIRLLENRISTDTKSDIDNLDPHLPAALSFVYVAIESFEEKDKKSQEFFDALIACRKQMSQVKKVLGGWNDPIDTDKLA